MPAPRLRAELARRLGQNRFLHYIYATAPFFIFEAWHCLAAEYLENLFHANITRLLVNLPPRAGKSEVISTRFPPWAIGNRPTIDLMQVSYSQDLASGFGRSVRDQISSPEYERIFPGVNMREDLRGSKHWEVQAAIDPETQTRPTSNGVYWSAGVGSGIAGKGWTLGLIDDPLSEQDKDSPQAIEKVNNWYGPGFYTRRQAAPAQTMIGVLMTRWSGNDLASYLLNKSESGGEFADKWTHLSIPAVLDAPTADRLRPYAEVARDFNQLRNNAIADKLTASTGRPHTPIVAPLSVYEAGGSYAPVRWPMHELMRSKDALDARSWNSLYMQNPSSEAGNIILREYWKPWPSVRPPKCELVYACYDTSFSDEIVADYSARTTWGMFRDPKGDAHLILLEAWRGKVTYPELKAEVRRHAKAQPVPTTIWVEKRATGAPLVQEMKRVVPQIRGWLPPTGVARGPGLSRSGQMGKRQRGLAITGVMENGMVHYMPYNNAIGQVIEECAAFPFGSEDDWYDTVTMAVLIVQHQLKALFQYSAEDEDADDEAPPIQTQRGLRLAASGGVRR